MKNSTLPSIQSTAQNVRRNQYIRQSRVTIQKWRWRLAHMNEEGVHMHGAERLKYKEYREELEYQVERASIALQQLLQQSDQEWQERKLRLEYIFEALEDTWAYWQSLVEKSRKLEEKHTLYRRQKAYERLPVS